MGNTRVGLLIMTLLLLGHLDPGRATDSLECSSCVDRKVLSSVYHEGCESFFSWLDGQRPEVTSVVHRQTDSKPAWLNHDILNKCSGVWELWSCASAILPCYGQKADDDTVLSGLKFKMATGSEGLKECLGNDAKDGAENSDVAVYADALLAELEKRLVEKADIGQDIWTDVSGSQMCSYSKMIRKIRLHLTPDKKACPKTWAGTESFRIDGCKDDSDNEGFRNAVLTRMDRIQCPRCSDEKVHEMLKGFTGDHEEFEKICSVYNADDACTASFLDSNTCGELNCERLLGYLQRMYCRKLQLKPAFKDAYIDEKGRVVYSLQKAPEEFVSGPSGNSYSHLCSGGSSTDILEILDSVFLNVTSEALCSLSDVKTCDKGKKCQQNLCKEITNVILEGSPDMPDKCAVVKVCERVLHGILMDRCQLEKPLWVDTLDDASDPAGFDSVYLTSVIREELENAADVTGAMQVCRDYRLGEPGSPARYCVDQWRDDMPTSHASCISSVVGLQEVKCQDSKSLTMMKDIRSKYFPRKAFDDYCKDPSLVLPAKRRLLAQEVQGSDDSKRETSGKDLCGMIKSRETANSACKGVKWFGQEGKECSDIPECGTNVHREHTRHCGLGSGSDEDADPEDKWYRFFKDIAEDSCNVDILRDVYKENKDAFCASKRVHGEGNVLEITSMMSNVYFKLIEHGCTKNKIGQLWSEQWKIHCHIASSDPCVSQTDESSFRNGEYWGGCQYDDLRNAIEKCKEDGVGCPDLVTEGVNSIYHDYGCPAYSAYQAACDVCGGSGGITITIDGKHKSGALFKTGLKRAGAMFAVRKEELEPTANNMRNNIELDEAPENKNMGNLRSGGLVDNTEDAHHHRHGDGGLVGEDAESLFRGLWLPV